MAEAAGAVKVSDFRWSDSVVVLVGDVARAIDDERFRGNIGTEVLNRRC